MCAAGKDSGLQAAFAVVQIVPKYQSLAVVTEGVRYWYVAVCLAQAGWTVAFAQDVVWLSMAFMLLILGCLAALNYSVVRAAARTPADGMHPALCYVCFRAPFLLHLGWITAASFVNANVEVVRYARNDRALQLGAPRQRHVSRQPTREDERVVPGWSKAVRSATLKAAR